MKALIRTITITVLIILSLTTTGSALAQNAAEEETLVAIEKAVALAEKEAEIVQRQAEAVQIQAEAVQQQEGAALQQATNALSSRLRETLLQLEEKMTTWQDSGAGTVLVIPTAEMKPQDLVTVAQDLNIMSRVLDKKLYPERDSLSRSFWPLASGRHKSFLSGDDRITKGIYIQGYGALFLLKVDFPLLAGPQTPEVKKTEEDIDSVWQETIREIYAPEEVRRRQTDRPEEKYNPERVESLKIILTRALRHAANIRALKPDEIVILTVISEISQPTTSLVTRVYSIGEGRGSRNYIATEPRTAGSGSFSHTVLTIRAKKSDIDAFAKGDLDFDQFRQRTQLLSGPYVGGGEVGRVEAIVSF